MKKAMLIAAVLMTAFNGVTVSACGAPTTCKHADRPCSCTDTNECGACKAAKGGLACKCTQK